MTKCEHKHTEIVDGMVSSAEPPYDQGDFWWYRVCKDCDEELGEGDGWDWDFPTQELERGK